MPVLKSSTFSVFFIFPLLCSKQRTILRILIIVFSKFFECFYSIDIIIALIILKSDFFFSNALEKVYKKVYIFI